MAYDSGGLGGAPGKGPGWYPVGENPNDQVYWDGQSWTARRRWAGAGWVGMPFEAVDTAAATHQVPPAGGLPPGVPVVGYQPGFAGSYGYPGPPAGARGTPVTVTVGSLLLFVCGIVIMVGSTTSWVSLSILGQTLSVSGTEVGIAPSIGINGWTTFTAGVVLVVLGGLILASAERSLRVVALVVAVVSLALAIFAVVRILQRISQSHLPAQLKSTPLRELFGGSASIGYGLILALVAATGATIAAAVELRASS